MKDDQIENDYVLGTSDAEIDRLGLQHKVWRPRALDAWRRSGISVGHTILDLGCGPGFSSLDLADIVGGSGQVVAIDRSRRFLTFARHLADRRQMENITFHELDVCQSDLPYIKVDGIWARWIFCFLKDAGKALEKAARMLAPGGVFVLHEYFSYSTWQTMPPSEEMTEFVDVVKRSWVLEGGEPDISLRLVPWLLDLDLEIMEMKPIVDVVDASNFVWQWPSSFLDVGLDRLTEKGLVSAERASYLRSTFWENQKNRHAKMVTPGVLEIIARRR
jgi:SAM-dependent methyltransferase